MGTLNKQSVRDEFDQLKSTFHQLLAEDKVSPECKALFDGFIFLLNVILAIFFEKTTKKTSKNSGIPSSQTQKDNSALTESGSKGKGLKETKQQAPNTRTVETVDIITATHCHHCGASLEGVPCDCGLDLFSPTKVGTRQGSFSVSDG